MKKHLKIFLSMLLLFQLTIAAKGSSTSNSSPLLCIPSDHSYTAEVEMLIEGKATGGLIIFYNNRYNSGILADSENILANLRSRQFVTEINNTVDMYYNNDGEKWTRIQNSIEVSSMHHNVLSGFMSLRIGLCAIGKGRVTFKKFIYKPII
jgi:xylan 1,4-beta-xylosidase